MERFREQVIGVALGREEEKKEDFGLLKRNASRSIHRRASTCFISVSKSWWDGMWRHVSTENTTRKHIMSKAFKIGESTLKLQGGLRLALMTRPSKANISRYKSKHHTLLLGSHINTFPFLFFCFVIQRCHLI